MTIFLSLMLARKDASILWRAIKHFVSLTFARVGASITMERNNEFRLFVVCQNRCFNNYGEK